MKQNIYELIIILCCISGQSCKTIQPASSNTQQKRETIPTYTILIRLQDISGTNYQILDKIHKVFTTSNVKVDNTSLLDNINEIYLISDRNSYNSIDIAWKGLNRIPGVIAVFIYKNEHPM